MKNHSIDHPDHADHSDHADHPDHSSSSLYRMVLFGLLLLLCLTPCTAHADEQDNPFAHQIRPLLVKYCVGCHNATEAESNLRLDSLQRILHGGDAGSALVPGNLEASLIWRRISGLDEPKMPPEDSAQPTAEEREILRRWIEQGAPGKDAPWSLQDQWKLLQQQGKATTQTTTATISSPSKKTAPAITAAAVLPDQSMLAGRYGRLERLNYDPSTEAWVPSQVIDLIGKVSQIRLDHSATRAAVASGLPGFGGQIHVMVLNNPSEIYRFEAHRDMLYSAVLHPSQPWVATAGYDRVIRLWNYKTAELLRSFEGHNGAVYDLDFDPTGQILASASADETIKIWRVDSGERLDTFGQCEAEQYAVRILSKSQPSPNATSDAHAGVSIIACGADRRIRQWELPSLTQPSVSPMRHAVFAHEATIHLIALSPDHRFACTAAQDNSLKIWDTQRWDLVEVLPKSNELPTSLAWVSSTPESIRWTTLQGDIRSRIRDNNQLTTESDLLMANQSRPQATIAPPTQTPVEPLPANIEGVLMPDDRANGGDWFAFTAKRGEQWKIETIAAREKSPLDSHLEITDSQGNPVLRTRLQAVRESYFTFRGKDSTTIDDFRLHRWEDMELNELLYASGEVVRLWLYPRGPDSGFKVYPGSGSRYTYFGTSPVAHALNEPAWIVRELQADQAPISNGQPVFNIFYSNDDDPQRKAGKDSIIFFSAPSDGTYYVRLRDTRGFYGEAYKYKLSITPPTPHFDLKLETPDITLRPNVGTEFTIATERFDGLDSEIEVSLEGLPEGISVVQPLTIQPDQLRAIGQMRATNGTLADLPKEFEVTLVATSKSEGKEWKSPSSPKLKVKLNEKPTMQLKVVDRSAPDDAPPLTTLRVRPGETVSAKLVIERGELAGDIAFGGDDSGRNLPHGCFVDNIGLNGLLIPAGQSTREVFITAAPIASPQSRWFHLRANVDGNPTTLPIELIVVNEERK
jgi:hypothetical protein